MKQLTNFKHFWKIEVPNFGIGVELRLQTSLIWLSATGGVPPRNKIEKETIEMTTETIGYCLKTVVVFSCPPPKKIFFSPKGSLLGTLRQCTKLDDTQV